MNPSAGAGRAARCWPRVQRMLAREGLAFSSVQHDGLAGLSELAAEAARSGHTTVAAMGGDGTIREVAGGLAGTDTVLGIIPAGTGNGTAHSLALPLDLPGACRTLARGVERQVDLGSSLRGSFLNVAGVGLDASIAQEYRLAGHPTGLAGYIVAALRVLPEFRPAQLTVTLDGACHQLRGTLVVVGNGRYWGKGIRIAATADPADGQFDVSLVHAANLRELAGLVPLLLRGRLAEHPLVTVRRARRVSVTGDVPLLVHLDGDVVGHTPDHFELLPSRLKVLVPVG
ncbi:MAG TPA: diacylglycerol kinase family protein [Bacillota bacterium]|nr:diacylglycerol kinase family protein [Bacillota bacterium]